MKISQKILDELKEISPLIADIERVNIFQVPEAYFNDLHVHITDYVRLTNRSATDNVERHNIQQVPGGYFDSLSNNILSRIKASDAATVGEELQYISTLLLSLKDKNVFTVPEHYFETVSNAVIERIHIDSEALSPLLLSLKDKNVFTVPDLYFQTVSNAVIERIHIDSEVLSPLLLSLKDKNVFTVPDLYFETVSNAVIERIHIDSEVLSPLLLSLKDKIVFTVPDLYFEKVTDSIINSIKTPAKVVSINKKISWWRYAAAAVITGFIAVTSLQVFNNANRHSTVLPQYIQESFQYKTENDVNAGIAKLSDDDIAKYLEKNGNALDNMLLTTNTDVSEMPSQTDYLNDENTLNEYLDKIDGATNNNSKP